MSFTRKVALNTVVQVVSRIIQTIGGLVILKVLAVYLGVEGIGKLTTIFAYVGLFGILADMGLFLILVREVARQPKKERDIVNNIITLRALSGVLMFTVGFALVWFLKYTPDVKVGVGIYSAAMFWPLVGGTVAGVFQGHFRIDKAAIGDIVRTIISVFGVAIAARFNTGLSGVLVGYVIANAVGFLVQLLFLYQYVTFRPAFDIALWRRLVKEALPMGLVTILGFIYFKIDTVMLSLMKPSTDVGIYGPSFKILEVMGALPAYFMSAVMPIFSRYAATNDPRIKDAFQRAFDALFLAAAPIAVGTILTAPALVNFLTTSEFASASTVSLFGRPATGATALQILIITAIFLFTSHAFGYILVAAGHQKRLIAPYIFFTLFNVAVNFMVIPRFSYIGAAAATVATEIIVIGVTAYLVKRHLGLIPSFKRVRKIMLASLAMGAVVYFFKDNIASAAATGALTYLLVLYFLRGVSRDDITRLVKS